MPEFSEGQQLGMLIGGDIIHVKKDIDFDRVAGSKSKKTKGIYQMMLNQMNITRAADG